MRETRIEILKDGKWIPLRLTDSSSVKYNARINKIGGTSSREIGGTNTFSLMNIQQNIVALGINVFNPYKMAKALNIKYDAKYYVDNQLIQKGFLLINNTNGGTINVNFIDEAFGLVSKWGSTTYQDLLRDSSLPIDSDYETAIDDLRNYSMPVDSVLQPLGEVGTRGYNLCLFPNNLNAVGDKFQKDDDGLRQDDVFNPYQCRPIFNAKSLYDLATERFGYTADYDDSVDWDTIEKTYMIATGSSKNEEGESGLKTVSYPGVGTIIPYSSVNIGGAFYASSFALEPTSGPNSIKPSDIPNWTYNTNQPYFNKKCIFVPNSEQGNLGQVRFTATTSVSYTNKTYQVVAFWNNIIQGQDVVYTSYSGGLDGSLFPEEISIGSDYDLDLTVDKTILDTKPTDAGGLIGMIVFFNQTGVDSNFRIISANTIETYTPEGVVEFDDFMQYRASTVDMAFAASRETLKTLLVAHMNKEGILMNINSNTKVVKFFTYGHYETQKEDGNFDSWDEYLIRESMPTFKTDYGNKYGKLNKIGLSSPFPGNEVVYALSNQGEDSRYKDLSQDYNPKFKDVTQVVNVNNSIGPYLEYTNTGLGLVEYYQDDSSTFEQQRADGTSQGNITNIPEIVNVNYNNSIIPNGVKQWYKLVDTAVRVKAKFLLPESVVRNLDLSRPIYVGELNGFYIIEELSEYEDSSKPVMVKLIKLVDNLSSSFELILTPSIELASQMLEPGNPLAVVTYRISNIVTFNNYTPTGATILGKLLDDSPENGGTPTGFEFTSTLTIVDGTSDYTFDDGITLTNNGWYEIQVTDSDGLESNIEYVEFDTTITLNPDISVFVGTDTTSDGIAQLTWNYIDHTPTSATLSYQKINFITKVAEGPLVTDSSWSLVGGSTAFDFGATGFYRVELDTNEASYTSDDNLLGGWSVI